MRTLDFLNPPALTWHPDRGAFIGRWGEALWCSGRRGNYLAVLLIKLDGLEHISNRPGLPLRDRVLNTAAAALCHCTRSADVPGGIGADEFAVVAAYWEPADVLQLANRVRTTFESMCEACGITCTMSIGIAGTSHAPQHQLMQMADRALARSKNYGGNRVEFCSDHRPAARIVHS